MNRLKVQGSMDIQLKKAYESIFDVVLSENKLHKLLKCKITISQNDVIFAMLSILKTLSFFLVAEAITGLTYHHPVGENSSFSSHTQGWIGYSGTHVPMFVYKLGLSKPRQT